ncbi:hypothetical protein [Kocuria rosea]|uniref:hypothetical protein n=1 Tax=Kocuria rosea TaxID=1275 RepID=UPI0011AA3CB6|nr:hypothetical protein [Kocuria rosea]
MSDDNTIKGWWREGPGAKLHILKPHQLNTIDEVDAGFDEGCMAPAGTEPRAAGKENPTPREIGFDRGLEFGLRLTDYAERSRHPSAQVRSRRDRL